ncbi:hypothetical protein BRD17_09135 [Halobacteriales archaeon SW_7_68_16]|nr:MAG: hypothetical protein BRD17_09135 [Halobacteriales archaeon SW_7_68_16]
MEVETVDEQGRTWRAFLIHALTGGAFVTAFILPVFFSIPYVKVLKTVVLVLVLCQIGRMLLSSILAFARPRTPPDLPADADLPSVSVIVPAYNEASVLPETIEACREIDYPDELLEVILCYEADSHDATGEICRRAADDDRFVAVERDEEGGGKATATNFALERASGEIIASIDADHWLKEDAVKRAVKWFNVKPDVWCVKGRCYGRNPTDSIIALHATVERHVTEKADLYAREVLKSFTLFGGGQAFFRRKVFDEVGAFDEEVLVEDIDMSTRIHAYGKELRVDPGIITFEEQPATLSALWSQRKRWARGWMQVAARYLDQIPGSRDLSVRKRADAAYTFAYAIILPFLIIGAPLPVLDLLYLPTAATAYIPHSQVLWTILGVFPPLMAAFVFIQDYRDGLDHHWTEYLAACTLGIYLFLQTFVYVVAFLEEFVYRKPSVYVTTSRADDE